MLNSMDNMIVDLVTHIDTVKQLWSYLGVLYSGHNNLSHIYELSQEFYRVDRQGRSLTQYFAYFNNMYEELNALMPITGDVKQMQAQKEQLAVMGFLGGLRPEYESVHSQILGGVEVASFADTFSRVLRVSRETTRDLVVHGDTVDKSALVAQSTRSSGRGMTDFTRGGRSSGA
ncbi:UBN2_3 domain-containing protein [Cephalotus follicularis]|uniref:UBN2_3 domain-containing protein n=1 Tax=Cephalotus follicularis TaxID=3775 RepID=A0A1Q3BLG9_CEPFO|nr:UBN2_3 domain-containing protein [Cephalotus follicularis]